MPIDPQSLLPTVGTSLSATLPAYVPTPGLQGQALYDEASAAAVRAGFSQDDLNALRSQSVLSAQDFAQSVAGYVNLTPNQTAAVEALSKGDYRTALSKSALIGGVDLGVPSALTTDLMLAGKSIHEGNMLGAIAPIMGGAMQALVLAGAVTGPEGAAACAMVAGAVQLTEETSALFRSPMPNRCKGAKWAYGDLCFGGTIPYGPKDPTWQTLGDWFNAKNAFLMGRTIDGAKVSSIWAQTWTPGLYLYGPAFTAYQEVLEVERGTVVRDSPLKQDPRFDGLRVAFARSILANLEKAINGHPVVTPAQLLQQTIFAWNIRHANGAIATFPTLRSDLTMRFVDGSAFKAASPQTQIWEASMIELVAATDTIPWAPLQLYAPIPPDPYAAAKAAVTSRVDLVAQTIRNVNANAAAVLHNAQAAQDRPWIVAGLATLGAGALVGGSILWKRMRR